MISKVSFSAFGALAAASMAVTPIAAQAQQAQGEAESAQPQQGAVGPFGIPSDAVMFEQQDPNVRSATAKVNGSVVTGTDINQRVALVLASSPNAQVSAEEMQRLRMQVLRNLIDETLKIQAAAAQDMAVSSAEVDQRYLGLAQQNFPDDVKKMDQYLLGIGSSPTALKRQIEGEIAWSYLVRRNVAPFISVSADEVNETIERMKTARGQSEYRIAEIYLPATQENIDSVAQNADQILEQIREGGNFQAYARQYSASSTAAVGGDLGFVRLETLPDEMAAAARELEVGQILGPVQIPGGLVIMLLIDKRQVLTADMRDAVLDLKQISITFDPGMSQEQANARVSQFAEAVGTIQGCGDADRVAASVNASVVNNNAMTVRDLPEQLQSAMLELPVGQATPPFGSLEDGVRVLLLCGRDDPEVANEPDFDQIMDQIEQDRIEKRAQRFLRDLRNDAIIEYN
ncbi:MAG: peptidylprolyl isomerase [Erythrobacter sp.]|nr:peptidylprolyl isomerase [Erythrobacter sp.]NCQ64888.1 peptidylprolyl isomerase [Alphaproteobacteria bacterium]